MDSKSIVFRRISAGMIGAAAGALMAVILLVLFQNTAFRTDGVSFGLIILCASVLPLCLDLLRKREIEPEIAEAVMILISALICFGYASITAGNEAARERMITAVLWAHAGAVLVYAVQWAVYLVRRGIKK